MLQISERPSPNFDERGGVKPSLIILHYTDMENAEAALERLCDAEAKVSAHYCVDEDGAVVQLVDEGKRAWHAGKSFWAGETDINAHSIGIEIVNPGHTCGYRPFPDVQIEAVTALCQGIMARHGIEAKNVLAHSDVSPDRKRDPGELFPWKVLAEQGVGIFPVVQDIDMDASGDIVANGGAALELLGLIGYDTAVDFSVLTAAFHRHYCPETFGDDGDPAADFADFDAQSAARLLALVRAMNSTKT